MVYSGWRVGCDTPFLFPKSINCAKFLNKMITKEEAIDELLTRGVEEVYPSRDYLRSRLLDGKQITVFLGVDPTGPSLHIGHMIPLLKLREFQDLGHRIIFLIGDFTATIGDPTDKTATRVALTREQVLENARLYKEQASHFINFGGENPASIKYNSDWLAKMSFADVLNLASKMTYAQTIKRDMFQKRIKEDKDLYLHEFLYPLMQGYDSVVMDVDGEIGGNDQTFNMLAGRDLMKKMKSKEKFVLTMKLLADAIGKKMGKTEGNMVTLSDSSVEMYGKVMSWTDNMIISGLELCTKLSLADIEGVRDRLNAGGNPKEEKMKLGREVVKAYYGPEEAEEAEREFIKIFSEGGVPDNIPDIRIENGTGLKNLLLNEGFVKSAGDFRRLVEEGAMSLDGEKIIDPNFSLTTGGILRIGKKRFLKVTI
ncbi:MAG: tyrosine--tRNA ligase [Candidatus Vogelbacteria bacterium]|nr:tyrosine--tRNA ligase [Candidatus Vogelbacteria bacterium]